MTKSIEEYLEILPPPGRIGGGSNWSPVQHSDLRDWAAEMESLRIDIEHLTTHEKLWDAIDDDWDDEEWDDKEWDDGYEPRRL